LLAKAVPEYTSFIINAAESSGNGARLTVNRELAGVRPAWRAVAAKQL
jgi:hypothetical protein